MSDNNLNKKFFTEADSPIPLLPPDMAWSNMQKKLDAEKKKKRGFFFWLFPSAGLAVLLMGIGAVLWWKQDNRETILVKTGSNKVQYRETGPVKNNDIVVNKSTQRTVSRKDAAPDAPVIKNEGNATIATAHFDLPRENKISKALIASINKVKNKKRTLRSKPILTAADVGNSYPEKRSRFVRDKAVQNETDKTLPFAFPEQVRLTDSIMVRANLPLPASLFREPASPDSNHKKDVWGQAGLQWNVPITSNAHNYYAKGPNGRDQLYRLLLPGAWISLNKNKQRVIATVNPFFTAPSSEKIYDSIRLFNRQMIKMFGFQAGLQYGYQVSWHWWVGGGVDASWWKKGLVYATNDSMGSYLYTVNPKKAELITNFQLSASVSTGYQFKACEGFLQVSVPFNKKIKSFSTPIWVQLGVRWRLLNLQCKQK